LESQCDILVLDDLQMLSPLGARSLDGRQTTGTMGIVLIGMEENENQFLLAVRSGISAYLLNDASASDVVTAVRAAARGEAVCPPKMCLALFHVVAKGLTNKEIAFRLNLSEFTIKNHIHRIMKQVEAESRSEAVQAARASGYPMMV
jgi:DNA-binding NarL/FixJ family response regulator